MAMRLWFLSAILGWLLSPLAPDLRAQELDWAQKMFSELEHDFRVVARGADVRHRIQITNLYKEMVTVANVSTSCGCISAKVSQTTIPSDATIDLELTLDTKNHMRQKDPNVDVRVTFDGVNFKDVRIPIHAYIRTDVVFQPGAAEFGTLDAGAGSEQKLSIKYAGRDDWQIREVRSPRPYVSGSVQELHRGGGRVEYSLTVTIAPGAPEGQVREQLQLITDDVTNPYVPVLVTASIEPDIVVATPEIILGTLSPGVEKTVRVILRGRKPFAIESIECDSPLECFKVKLSKDPKSVHILPLTVMPPDTKGDLSEKFTVHIAGRTELVTFRASGRVE
jgi:hypothetical protein